MTGKPSSAHRVKSVATRSFCQEKTRHAPLSQVYSNQPTNPANTIMIRTKTSVRIFVVIGIDKDTIMTSWECLSFCTPLRCCRHHDTVFTWHAYRIAVTCGPHFAGKPALYVRISNHSTTQNPVFPRKDGVLFLCNQ